MLGRACPGNLVNLGFLLIFWILFVMPWPLTQSCLHCDARTGQIFGRAYASDSCLI